MHLALQLRNLRLQALDALIEVNDKLAIVVLVEVLGLRHIDVDAAHGRWQRLLHSLRIRLLLLL